MERLTTDKPQSNEAVLLNLAFAENHEVKIRGMESDFMDLIKEQCRKHGCYMSENSQYEVAEAVTECAFSNSECPIFLLFSVATQAAELRERLKMYEDACIDPANVSPVVHGRWGWVDGDNPGYESGHSPWAEYSCSECGNEVAFTEGEYGFGTIEDEAGNVVPFKFCPFCGAKMDGGAE